MQSPLALFDDYALLRHQSFSQHPYHVWRKHAENDFLMAKQFLLQQAETQYLIYRQEVERYLLWAWLIKAAYLPQLKPSAFEEYLRFSESPPKDWTTKHKAPPFVGADNRRLPNPAWRPYILASRQSQYVFNNPSKAQVLSTLNTFYDFLLQDDYVTLNPVLLLES